MPQAGGTIAQSLLMEIDQEAANTRKALERLPDDKFSYKPHPKSGTMGWLAGHIGQMLEWGAMTMQTDSFDVNPPGGSDYKPANPANREELLKDFDRYRAAFRAAIAAGSDADFMKPWSLLSGGNVVFTMPRVAVIRGMILNHIVHHRGQLTVYMRMNDIPVPSIYGPSADEKP